MVTHSHPPIILCKVSYRSEAGAHFLLNKEKTERNAIDTSVEFNNFVFS